MDVSTLLLAAIVGAATGVFYYGGLWLTVRRLSRVKNPTFWSNLSLLIRLSVMLGLCYSLGVVNPLSTVAKQG